MPARSPAGIGGGVGVGPGVGAGVGLAASTDETVPPPPAIVKTSASVATRPMTARIVRVMCYLPVRANARTECRPSILNLPGPSGTVAGLVPGLHDASLAFPAQDPDGRRTERERAPRAPRQPDPARGEDAQEVPVGEQERVALDARVEAALDDP